MGNLKITVKTTTERPVTHLVVDAGVRYWEDAKVDGIDDEEGVLIPFRKGDGWCPTIELETGKIINWPEGKTAEIHYKVCDEGIYTLIGDDGDVVARIDGYVPAIMCPKGSGFGDYIIMDIDSSGVIQDWRIDLAAFEDG